MNVSSATAAAAPSGKPSVAEKNALNYDSFLRLLVAEMQNQDPTSPADSAQYLSQLASFAAVEQGVATNTKLEALLAAANMSSAGSLIGQEVQSLDGSLSGKVQLVEITAQGAIAVLDTGGRLALADGLVIGAP